MRNMIRAGAGALVLLFASFIITSVASAQVGPNLDLGAPDPGGATSSTNAGSRSQDPNRCRNGERCILVQNTVGLTGPMAARPYQSGDNVLLTLEEYNAMPGSRGVEGFNFIARENRTMCTVLGSFAMENIQLYREWAALYPEYSGLEQAYIDLEDKLRRNTGVRRGAGVLQVIAGFWENPIKYGLQVLFGVGGYEATSTVSDLERELSRQGNLLSIRGQRLGIRSNMLSNREREWWARASFQWCSDVYGDALAEGYNMVPSSITSSFESMVPVRR